MQEWSCGFQFLHRQCLPKIFSKDDPWSHDSVATLVQLNRSVTCHLLAMPFASHMRGKTVLVHKTPTLLLLLFI